MIQVLNPLNASVALIKISQLICTVNQLTGFCMSATLAVNGFRLLEKRVRLKTMTL